MRRGPYQKYLDRYGNCVMPRSTYYQKMKQLMKTQESPEVDCSSVTAVGNCNCHSSNYNSNNTDNNQELEVDEINDVYSSNNIENSVDMKNYSNLWLQDELDEHEMLTYEWFHNEYHKEIEDNDTWFDAEDIWDEPFNETASNDLHDEKQSHRNTIEESYNQTLCKCTSITRGEALLMTLLLGAQQSLTWTTITSILSLINTLFGENVVPESKYQLFKTLQLKDEMISYHMFCTNCLLYISTEKNSNSADLKCAACGIDDNKSNISFFLTLDMETQLKKILQDSEVQNALNDHFEGKMGKSDGNVIKNITDGEIYKKLSAANESSSNNFNLTYTFNTDGCQASKSSKISTWPIYVIINELPAKLQTKHMVMCGIWINEKEPNMQLFLKPFVDQANKLSKDGFQWELRNRIIISKFIPVCAVVDSVARCKLLNMKKFNGLYGCTFCEHPTESVDGYRKYTMSTTIPPQRTDASIKNKMELTGRSEYGKDVMGVWGPSPLMNLKYFDLVDGMSPDYMHAFLLGAVKQHTNILLTSFGEEYYVGSPNQLEIINEIIVGFKHPTCITRSPRVITEREIWKASEWRSWLLFYSLICLEGVLPQKYLEHLAMLVEALNIMLSENIKKQELQAAGFLLIKYVVLYQEYFGKSAMTYNIHLLLHIEKSISNLGPLWCHNAFCFENENHFILKMEKSPSHVEIQVARRYIFEKSLPSFGDKIKKSNGFTTFCEKNITGRLKKTFQVNGCTLIGKGKKYTLNTSEQEIINDAGKCRSFNRFIFNGVRYTSEHYRMCQKINDFIVELKDGNFGKIKNICCFETDDDEKKIFIFYSEIKRHNKFFYQTKNLTVHNIEKCSVTEKLCVCEPEKIKQPCMLAIVHENNYIIKIPKGCFGD